MGVWDATGGKIRYASSFCLPNFFSRKRLQSSRAPLHSAGGLAVHTLGLLGLPGNFWQRLQKKDYEKIKYIMLHLNQRQNSYAIYCKWWWWWWWWWWITTNTKKKVKPKKVSHTVVNKDFILQLPFVFPSASWSDYQTSKITNSDV